MDARNNQPSSSVVCLVSQAPSAQMPAIHLPRYVVRSELIKAARKRQLKTDKSLYLEFLRRHTPGRHSSLVADSIVRKPRISALPPASGIGILVMSGLKSSPNNQGIIADTVDDNVDQSNDELVELPTFEEYQELLSATESEDIVGIGDNDNGNGEELTLSNDVVESTVLASLQKEQQEQSIEALHNETSEVEVETKVDTLSFVDITDQNLGTFQIPNDIDEADQQLKNRENLDIVENVKSTIITALLNSSTAVDSETTSIVVDDQSAVTIGNNTSINKQTSVTIRNDFNDISKQNKTDNAQNTHKTIHIEQFLTTRRIANSHTGQRPESTLITENVQQRQSGIIAIHNSEPPRIVRTRANTAQLLSRIGMRSEQALTSMTVESSLQHVDLRNIRTISRSRSSSEIFTSTSLTRSSKKYTRRSSLSYAKNLTPIGSISPRPRTTDTRSRTKTEEMTSFSGALLASMASHPLRSAPVMRAENCNVLTEDDITIILRNRQSPADKDSGFNATRLDAQSHQIFLPSPTSTTTKELRQSYLRKRVPVDQPEMSFHINNRTVEIMSGYKAEKIPASSVTSTSDNLPSTSHMQHLVKGSHKFAMMVASQPTSISDRSVAHRLSPRAPPFTLVSTSPSIPDRSKQMDIPLAQSLQVRAASPKKYPSLAVPVRPPSSHDPIFPYTDTYILPSSIPLAVFHPVLPDVIRSTEPSLVKSRKSYPIQLSAPFVPKPLRPIMRKPAVFPDIKIETKVVPPEPLIIEPAPEIKQESIKLPAEKLPEEIFVDDLVDRFSPKNVSPGHTQRFAFVNDYTRLMKRDEDLTTKNFINNNLATLDVVTKRVDSITDDELMHMIWNLYFYMKSIGRAIMLPFSMRQQITSHIESNQLPELKNLALIQIFKSLGKDMSRNYKALIGHCQRIMAASSTSIFFNPICAIFGSTLFATIDSAEALNARPKSLLDAVRRGTFKMKPEDSSESDSIPDSLNLATLSNQRPPASLSVPAAPAIPGATSFNRRKSLNLSSDLADVMTNDDSSLFNTEIGATDVARYAKDLAELRVMVTKVLQLTLSGHEDELSRETLTFKYLMLHFEEIFNSQTMLSFS